MTQPALAIQNLSVSYGKRPILRDLSVELQPGEVVAVLGRSGSGKSTLLRAASALLPWDSGSLQIQGRSITKDATEADLRALRSQCQIVFQSQNLFANMTVERNITLGLERVKRLDLGSAKSIARARAADLDIEHTLNRFPDQISGGEAQRAALAKAVAMEPSVLFLDEVTASLDPTSASLVVKSLTRLRDDRQNDLTILMATHMARFANIFADRIVFLANGAITDEFARGMLFEGTASEFAAGYLADLEATS